MPVRIRYATLMFLVYVIQSESSGKIYIGQTNDLASRIRRHNQELPSKKGSYTKLNKGSWKLIYSENCKTREDAIKREKQLKSAKGREFIKNNFR